MIGHLGARISALLDGQLPPAEAEEAWAHVYACNLCRDQVEREGWVKAQLAGLSGGGSGVPDGLLGSLRDLTPGERYAADPHASSHDLGGRGNHGRRAVAVVGSGAAGAAMLGVLALGLAPASTGDRRPPGNIGVTQPATSTPTPVAVSNPPASPSLSPAPSGSATSTPATTATPTARLRQVTVGLP